MDDVSFSVSKIVDFDDFLKENMEVLMKYGSPKEIYACLQKHEIEVCRYNTFLSRFNKIKEEYEKMLNYAIEKAQKFKQEQCAENSLTPITTSSDS
jgi:polynucleotide 5'-kinase involved in rRNA processing